MAGCRPSQDLTGHIVDTSMARTLELPICGIPMIPTPQMRAYGREHGHLSVRLLHRPNGLVNFRFKISVLYCRNIVHLLGLADRKLIDGSDVHPRLGPSLQCWRDHITE